MTHFLPQCGFRWHLARAVASAYVFYDMSLLRIAAVAVPSILLAAGCLPDPAGEFDDFNEKTKIADAGPKEAAPAGNAFKEAFSGEYFGICKTSISPTATNALRFSVTTTYAPPGDSPGKLKLVFTPLTAKKTTFAAADKIGNPIDLPETDVNAEGVATAVTPESFGVPGQANPITGSEIVANTLTIAAKVTAKDKFCADFSTKLVKPYASDVTAECIFLNLAEGAAIPAFTDADIDCP